MTKSKWACLFGAAGILAFASLSHPAKVFAQVVKATFVRSEDEPGRNVYQEAKSFMWQTASCGQFSNSSDECQITFSAVPANKRLVITSSSAAFSTQTPSGFSGAIDFVINTTASGQSGTAFLPIVSVGNFFIPMSSGTAFRGLGLVKLYADAGTTPVITLTANSLIGLNFLENTVTLSGYYVDIP